MFKKERMNEEKSFGKSSFDIKGYERRIKQNDRKIKDINESINSQKVEKILNTEDTKELNHYLKNPNRTKLN